MTRRVRPAIALVASIALGGAGCTSIDLPTDAQSGAELFVSQNCALCHGADGRSAFWRPGPDIVPALGMWTVDTLAEYLGDPEAWAARDPRLEGGSMPSFDHLTGDERERLARWVLTLDDTPDDD